MGYGNGVSSDLRYSVERRNVPKLDVVLLHVFLAGDMIISSRFYEFVGFSIRSPIFYLTVACLPFFFVRAMQKSSLPEIAVFLLLIVGMMVQTTHFAAISRQPENFNSIAQYYTMFSFIVFSRFIGEDEIGRLLSTIFTYSCVYVIIYVAASLMIYSGAMPGDLTSRLTQSDPERGARILIISSSTLYCLHYAYHKFVATRRAAFMVLLLLALAALFISQSRLLIVIVVLVWAAALVLPRRSALSVFSFTVFAAVSGIILYGMLDLQWNPFVVFGDDTSARIRTTGYDSIRQVLLTHPLLGAGIAANDKDMVGFTSNPTLSAADLGPIGIWFVFGAAGLALYVASVYAQCFCTRFGGCGSVGNSKTLQYTGCMIGLFGCLTPTWFNGSLIGLFFSLYFHRAAILRDRAQHSL